MVDIFQYCNPLVLVTAVLFGHSLVYATQLWIPRELEDT